MSNLVQRILTGIVFITLIIGSLWYNFYSAFAVMGLFLLLGLVEYFNLFKDDQRIQLNGSINSLLLFSTFLIFGLSLFPSIKPQVVVLVLPIIFISILTELWRKKENPIFNIGIVTLGFIYLVIPFSIIILLSKQSSHEHPYVIGMLLLIWTNDSFAYLSGRFFGKTKLFERISPKKTWEGTIGGIVFTLLVAYFISFWSSQNDLGFWLIAAILVAPSAILGDLLESLFKRTLNIKDSGTILPGHGGILDRFDATIYTIPFFYTWFIIYTYF